MAGRAKNFLLGCGLSCLAVIVLCIALTVGLVFWGRGKMRGVDESAALGQTLDERSGRSAEFVPWADGAIPAERMESFLRVREATAAALARHGESVRPAVLACGYSADPALRLPAPPPPAPER